MPARHSVRTVSGHEVHILANEKVSLSLVPIYGARVVSLKDLRSGREWLDGWSPASTRRLHAPSTPGDYLSGPLAGVDECLPTISRCRVAGRDLPDHGELWERPAPIAPDAAARGELVSIWSLRSLPLDFSRRITLSGATVRFSYTLTNRSVRPTPFIWAWHPLFALRRGDRVEFPRNVRKVITRGQVRPWPQAFPGHDLSLAEYPIIKRVTFKGFVGPLASGSATIHDSRGHRLALRWPLDHLPYAGFYINRSLRPGTPQLAIEPTNARSDKLEAITRDKSPLHWLGPRETREWTLTARVDCAD